MVDYENCKYFVQEDVTPWHSDVYDHPSYKTYCIKSGDKRQLIYPPGQCKRCKEKESKTMAELKRSVKYEVVIGVPDDTEYPIFCPEFSVITGTMMKCQLDEMRSAWKKYAKEFYEANDIYVSAIAIPGRALYHEDWGCPENGERVMSFHCTANPEFIKDLDMYEKGVLYITKKLKKEFKQHTITITKLPAEVFYLTDTDNEEE